MKTKRIYFHSGKYYDWDTGSVLRAPKKQAKIYVHSSLEGGFAPMWTWLEGRGSSKERAWSVTPKSVSRLRKPKRTRARKSR